MAVGVVAALAVVAIGYSAFSGGEGSDLVENRVAVMAFENATGDPELDQLGRIVAAEITDNLMDTPWADVVPSETTVFSLQMAGATTEGRSPGNPITVLANDTRSATVVSGAIHLVGDFLRLEGRITDTRTMSLVETVLAAGPMESQREGVDALRQRVVGALAAHLDPRLEEWVQTARHFPRLDAYVLHMRGLEAYYRRDYETAADLNVWAHALDTAFLKPLLSAARAFNHLRVSAPGPRSLRLQSMAKRDSLISVLDERRTRLSEWEDLQLAYLEGERDGDLHGLLQVWRRVHERYPGTDGAAYGHGWAALRFNRPREAIEAFRTADPERWDARPEVWLYWASACFVLGEHEEALRVSRAGRELYADHLPFMWREATDLAALGRFEEMNGVFDEVVGLPLAQDRSFSPGNLMRLVARVLRAFGHPDESKALLDRALSWYQSRPESEKEQLYHRRQLALVHYDAGEWAEARKLFEASALEDPDNPSLLEHLGLIAVRQGRESDARAISARLSDLDPPTAGAHLWSKGRIAAALGEKELAVTLLEEAFAHGFAFGWYWGIDPDLEPLRGYEPFEDFIRPKG